MLNKRIIPPVVVALALVAPGAAFGMPGSDVTGSSDDSAPVAATQDLRSPDSRDAASGVASSSLSGTVSPSTRQDLRSPDVRDAASGIVPSTSGQDLRSPDVRDAASGNVRPAEPVPTVQTVTTDDGFEWASAAIGAAAVLAIVLALGAAAALVVPRRRLRSTNLPH